MFGDLVRRARASSSSSLSDFVPFSGTGRRLTDGGAVISSHCEVVVQLMDLQKELHVEQLRLPKHLYMDELLMDVNDCLINISLLLSRTDDLKKNKLTEEAETCQRQCTGILKIARCFNKRQKLVDDTPIFQEEEKVTADTIIDSDTDDAKSATEYTDYTFAGDNAE